MVASLVAAVVLGDLVLLLLTAPPWTWSRWQAVFGWQPVVAYAFVLPIAGTLLGNILHSQLQKAFPAVRFEGHFFDTSRRPRVILKWATSVIVPIILRVFHDLWPWAAKV
jgi:hypothetical protein